MSAMPDAPLEFDIEELMPTEERVESDVEMLGRVLHACVHAGASVSFILPFSLEDARQFWREKVLPGVNTGAKRVLVARSRQEIIGTVQLILGLPPNQRHRAEVAKLLVHPKARNRGVARALMTRLEQVAQSEGKSLITLDTRSGDMAESLYLSMGYRVAGVIPGYARGPFDPDLEPTSFLYKELQA